MVQILRAALFDFGGVLIASPFDAFTAFEAEAGLPSGLLRTVNSRNPDDNAWAQYERGEIDGDQFADAFAVEAAQLGEAVDGHRVIDLVTGIPHSQEAAFPAMVEAVQQCRSQGLGLALITNNVRPMADNPEARWVNELFDVVVESCLVGARKPEAAIYERACHALGVVPTEAMMFDDLGVNLKTARALGMHTVKVTDPERDATEVLRLLAAGNPSS